jgi:small subunit ribosomal protein S20
MLRLPDASGGRLARHKSAEKRARQDLKRRERNRTLRSRTRGVVKTLRAEFDAGAEALEEKLRGAEGALRRAASKGVIPKRRASRLVSRLAKAKNRATAK